MNSRSFYKDILRHTEIQPIIFNNSWYIAPKDLLKIIKFAIKNDYRILGFEGFAIKENYLIPDANCIGDFSNRMPNEEDIQNINSTIDISKVDVIEIIVELNKA